MNKERDKLIKITEEFSRVLSDVIPELPKGSIERKEAYNVMVKWYDYKNVRRKK